MTVVVETLIFCDGGIECPNGEPYGRDGDLSRSITQLRAEYKYEGWVYHGKKDYCPPCASRLGLDKQS